MKKIIRTARKILLVFLLSLCFSFDIKAQGFFSTGPYTNNPKGSGATSILGWGENFDPTIDLRPAQSPDYGTMMINYHTGLTFSAHSDYGGIRFYNQGYPNAYDSATGSQMVMSITNGHVGIGTTSPRYRLDVIKQSSGSGLNLTGPAIGTRNDTGIDFSALNGISVNYSRIGLQVATGTIGQETGGLTFSTINSGILSEKMFIAGNGNVGIGTTTPSSKLTVSGSIAAREVNVTVNAGADFVFDKHYALRPLNELESFLNKNNHLPQIPAAHEMKKDGINLSDMNIKLLMKIEELTLYLIQQQKEIDLLKKELKL